jgi:excinuclease ABC subunit B
LRFEEFEILTQQTVYVSATPSEFELKRTPKPVEQIIRPTGLVDPEVTVRPTEGQIDDLIAEVKLRAKRKERTLVTTLTKRMAEDLTRYLQDMGLDVKYLHSEIDAIERVQILKDLRLGRFDCLVGVNLLREGLDLPEVSLVAVIDADKEGFLRSQTSLIQVAGRAARNINGQVIMYADNVTGSMKRALSEMNRRRKTQLEFNKRHDITPRSIEKAIKEGIEMLKEAEATVASVAGQGLDDLDKMQVIAELESQMELAARNLQFERAAELRDQIASLTTTRQAVGTGSS